MSHSSHQVVNHPEPEPEPSSPSPLPAPQPVDSQESIDLGDVAGDDEQASIRANNPDAIHMLKPGAADVHYFFDKSVAGQSMSPILYTTLQQG